MPARLYKCIFLRTGRPNISVFHPRQKGHWKYFYSLDELAKYINDTRTYPAHISNITKQERRILLNKIDSIFLQRHPQVKKDIINM